MAPNDAVREVLRHPSEVSVGRVPASPRLFQSGFCGTIKHGGCQILAAYAIGSSRARCAGSAPDAATAEIWHGAARTGQIRLWGFSSPWKSERCCGAGVRLRCVGSSAMVSRNQWNNAKRPGSWCRKPSKIRTGVAVDIGIARHYRRSGGVQSGRSYAAGSSCLFSKSMNCGWAMQWVHIEADGLIAQSRLGKSCRMSFWSWADIAENLACENSTSHVSLVE